MRGRHNQGYISLLTYILHFQNVFMEYDILYDVSAEYALSNFLIGVINVR